MKPRGKALLAAILAAFFAAALYWPTIGYDFAGLDDADYILNNEAISSGLTAEGIKVAFRSERASYLTPLTWISYMTEIELFGKEASSFHRTSVMLFALSTGLLCWLLFALSDAPWRSLLATALFAAHPLRVESVAWVSERKDLLSGLFLLLALLAWHRYVVGKRPAAYAAALIAMAVGLLAKPSLVILPVLLFVLDWWPFGRLQGLSVTGGRFPIRLILEKAPFLLLAGGAAIFASTRMSFHVDPLALGQRLDALSWSFFHYLGKTAWPVELAFRSSYSFSPRLGLTTGLSFVAVAGICAATYLLRRRVPSVAVGWLWFAVAVLPVSGIQVTGLQLYSDRFTYLPHMGLALALAGLTAGTSRSAGQRKRVLAATGALLLTIAVALTRRQLPIWRNGVALMEHSRSLAPNDPIVLIYLGAAYGMAHRYADAVSSYLEGLKIDNTHARGHLDLAYYANQLGQAELAEFHYRQGLRLQPDNPRADLDFGLLLAKQGRIAEAKEYFAAAVRFAPRDPDAHFNLARAAELTGLPAEAEAHYRSAIQIDPGDSQARVNLANLLAATGRGAAAGSLLREVVRPQAWSGDSTRGVEQPGKPRAEGR